MLGGNARVMESPLAASPLAQTDGVGKALELTTDEVDEHGAPIKITFKRVLLNKCQEEFEKGDSAIKAASEEAPAAAAEVHHPSPTPPFLPSPRFFCRKSACREVASPACPVPAPA